MQPGGGSDARLAAMLAESAGRLLLEIRRDDPGGDPRSLGRHGDLASNEFILGALRTERPDDAVLSEESLDDRARLGAPRVWIVDPLDGTREFAMHGRTDWAVHVALWQRDQGLTDAAVSQPALGEVHASDIVSLVDPAPPGDVAPFGGLVPGTPPGRRLRIVVSASRPPAFVEEVATGLGADLVPMGSAGAKAMAVLRGEADAYVHAGGQWEWDSAAPVGVTVAAGLHASRIDGTGLQYNQPEPYLPDLVIARPWCAEEILAAIADVSGGR